MREAFIFILIYLLGRFIFYDINLVINPRLKSRYHILNRSLIGLIAFILLKNIYAAVVIIILHELLILFDSLLKSKNTKISGFWYLSHLFIALFLFPWVIKFSLKILPELINPLHNFFFEFVNSTVILSLLTDTISPDKALLVLCGYIFTLKEGTIFIRLTLNRIRATPKKKDKPTQKDQDEYERGKLIGLLERTFVYFLIIFNQIGAIAVIIALKSLARFKELEDKNFAEYFLIGSLLSVMMAVIPAVIVRIILN